MVSEHKGGLAPPSPLSSPSRQIWSSTHPIHNTSVPIHDVTDLQALVAFSNLLRWRSDYIMSLAEQRFAQPTADQPCDEGTPLHHDPWRLGGHRRVHSSPEKPGWKPPVVALEVRAQTSDGSDPVAALDLARVSGTPLAPPQGPLLLIATPAAPTLQPAIASSSISPMPPPQPVPRPPEVRITKPSMPPIDSSPSGKEVDGIVEAVSRLRQQAQDKGKQRAEMAEGKVQKTRRNFVGPISASAQREAIFVQSSHQCGSPRKIRSRGCHERLPTSSPQTR